MVVVVVVVDGQGSLRPFPFLSAGVQSTWLSTSSTWPGGTVVDVVDASGAVGGAVDAGVPVDPPGSARPAGVEDGGCDGVEVGGVVGGDDAGGAGSRVVRGGPGATPGRGR